MLRRALVLGAAGFMGLHLCRRLKREGYHVIGLGREKRETPDCDLWIPGVVNLDLLTKIPQAPTIIFHLAMTGSITKITRRSEEVLAPTLALMDYLMGLKGPSPELVFFSSAAVYDGSLSTPRSEIDPIRPSSWYGVLKRSNEELLSIFAQQHGLKLTILRYFSIYGPGQRKQLFYDAFLKSRDSAHPKFFGTGEEQRDWIFIEDALHALDLLPRLNAAVPQILNVGSGTGTRVKDALKQFLNLVNQSHPEFVGEDLPEYPKHLVASSDRLRSLGWKPQISLEEGLSRTAWWLRHHATI